MKPHGVLFPFALVALVGLGIAGTAAYLATDTGGGYAALIAALVFAPLSGVAAFGLVRHFPHPVLGLCNTMTLLRLALASSLIAALLSGGGNAWVLSAIATLAFGLDGLDGYFARREGLTSNFGARFDMEVDSILALALACLAFQSGAAGAYVLMLGLPRYAFGAAQFFLPWLNAQLPERFSRKVVCVAQIAALLVMLLPPVASPWSDILAFVVALALVWSFWRDVVWLWRRRRA